MELLVRVVDKENLDDPALNNACTKRGDIIVMAEDGHNWGTDDKSNPDWRIIKMPGLKEANFSYLMLPDKLARERGEPHRRLHKINLDSPAFSQTFMLDGLRKEPAITVRESAKSLILEK